MNAPALAPNGGLPALARRRPSLDELEAELDAEKRPVAAGVVLRTKGGMVLFLKRGDDEQNYAGHWCLPGGGIDENESPEEAARREVSEETGHRVEGELRKVAEVVTGSGRGTFVTFESALPNEFIPALRDGEHVGYAWAPPGKAPQPLHPGVADLVSKMAGDDDFGEDLAIDSALRLPIALDSESVRTKVSDANGDLWRLEVKRANISKATVNPYLGREIPNAEALGLEPAKVYQLLRHPDELRKAAPTANMLPLLRKHRPISADDNQPWDVVGTTGSAAEFDDPYLANALSIWTREGVDDVESNRKRELSCGYSYRAEMTPGNFDGMPYDGVMRDIKFNHVALVEDGRAGPDVVVGDSNEEIAMSENRDLAKKLNALAMRQVSVGALMTYLRPKFAKAHLALDAKPPGIFAKVFDGVTGAKFKESKPAIAARLREAARPLLAKDASLDDVEKVLDMLDGHEIDGGDESVSPAQHNAMEAAAHGTSNLGIPKKVGEEFSEADKGKSFDAPTPEFAEFMKSKGATDEEVKKAWDMFPRPKAADEEDEEAAEKAKEEEANKLKEKSVGDEAKKAEDRKAMDSAIKSAVEAAKESILKSQREVRQAEAEVRPWVGELPATMSFDSAEQVRRQALKMLNVPGHDTMHADALGSVLAVQPKPGAQERRQEPRLGMDAAATESFAKRFPGSERIGAA